MWRSVNVGTLRIRKSSIFRGYPLRYPCWAWALPEPSWPTECNNRESPIWILVAVTLADVIHFPRHICIKPSSGWQAPRWQQPAQTSKPPHPSSLAPIIGPYRDIAVYSIKTWFLLLPSCLAPEATTELHQLCKEREEHFISRFAVIICTKIDGKKSPSVCEDRKLLAPHLSGPACKSQELRVPRQQPRSIKDLAAPA